MHQICLDNRMSTWSDKVVWFEVTVHDPKDDYYDDYIGEDKSDDHKYSFIKIHPVDSEEMRMMVERNEDTESMFDMKIEDIKESVHTMRTNLGKLKHFQFMQSASMSKVVYRFTSPLDKLK